MVNGFDRAAASAIRGSARADGQGFMDHRTPFPGRHCRAAVFLVPALMLLLGACRDKPEEEVVVDPPDLLYNEALANLEAGDARDAAEKFEQIDKEHPYSEYARRALIMSAFLNFRRGRYPEAVNEAKRYVTLFPASPDAAYAQYLIGESYFRQIPDVTREQVLSEKAIEAMGEVVSKYPDSEYANDARQKIDIATDQIAGKEMQIGRYYLERREFLAAVNRFKVVVEDYQTTRHVEEALHRLTESYLALGIVPEAQTAAALLGHNFPDSEWYRDSYALLGKAGIVPAENKGSWISRAFRGGEEA
jgi:outer membrane protein assembly factor BamD